MQFGTNRKRPFTEVVIIELIDQEKQFSISVESNYFGVRFGFKFHYGLRLAELSNW